MRRHRRIPRWRRSFMTMARRVAPAARHARERQRDARHAGAKHARRRAQRQEEDRSLDEGMPRVDAQATADLLARLVAIDSQNPDLVPGAAGEAGIAATIANLLRDH